MSQKSQSDRATDAKRPTIASLKLPVTLVALEEDVELRSLIERYEQLVCDWEGLTQRALAALARRAPKNR